ncbi:phosphoenolpyruvate mutase [Pseudomonas syringae]|uniref:phosphoenolpyruvate mutase n=1 Tax=Pseudomonas syringae pv. solidagae TaxID=264458 RepID=A0A0P9ZV95_PSESX|nr:phosphoenolpyruvate mutase [Pseudomonas syringae]KPY52731.1 Phosphoenolpyruvate phosphomutase [Pseudomonas syringae pv. solidagae]KTB85215.1 phosphoenolpyruvate phosphomutase [Pseudomonas syringae pv. syringae PD2774]RMT38821.1 Phosphoenolpyruvate phosphomutase [Pseudomonas syringae pv. solidagae]
MKKTTMLKSLIQDKDTSFLMEAHNALSARIAQESGFKGLWASGLSISASLGLCDRNEASWTQILDIVEFMSDHTSVPILVDGDTGFGNFNNVRRLTKKLCQRGIAGVCLEDKLFPKVNSFISGGNDLANADEFCGKLRAAKDSQLDDDFMVVARVEALISGLGMDEALERAHKYHRAGADAILIHSKRKDASEVLEFKELWKDQCPVIIVPTKYSSVETNLYKEAGISTVIWANHSLRASIHAMKRITQQIQKNENVSFIEKDIATLEEIFMLTGEAEAQLAEDKYLMPATA